MKRQNDGITLIALVITIIVLLILAGVSISLVVGDNGILNKSTNAASKNREVSAKEDVELEWSGATTKYWADWTNDFSKVNDLDFYQTELTGKNTSRGIIKNISYGEGEGTFEVEYISNEQNETYIFLVYADGKVVKKKGLILTPSKINIEKDEEIQLVAKFVDMEEKEIIYSSSDESIVTVDASGKIKGIANGEATVEAKTDGTSAKCKVIVATKLSKTANPGEYVDINIGYAEQADANKDYIGPEGKKMAWRVMSNENGVVELISTGNPLTFYHGSTDADVSLTKLLSIEEGTIILASNPTSIGYHSNGLVGYQTNGFSDNNVLSLFNNEQVFNGIRIPTPSDVNKSSFWSISDLKYSGGTYWLAGVDYSNSRLACQGPNNQYDNILQTDSVRIIVCLNSETTIKEGIGSKELPYKLNGINY